MELWFTRSLQALCFLCWFLKKEYHVRSGKRAVSHKNIAEFLYFTEPAIYRLKQKKQVIKGRQLFHKGKKKEFFAKSDCPPAKGKIYPTCTRVVCHVNPCLSVLQEEQRHQMKPWMTGALCCLYCWHCCCAERSKYTNPSHGTANTRILICASNSAAEKERRSYCWGEGRKIWEIKTLLKSRT